MTVAFGIPEETTAVQELTVQQTVLGRDIRFRNDYTITAAQDYGTIEGDAGIREAIYRRLFTRQGEYAFRPEYGAGLRDLVKQRVTRDSTEAIDSVVRDQLARDPRIEEVLEVVAEQAVLNGTPVFRIFVKVRSAGKDLRFEPFTFSLNRTRT